MTTLAFDKFMERQILPDDELFVHYCCKFQRNPADEATKKNFQDRLALLQPEERIRLQQVLCSDWHSESSFEALLASIAELESGIPPAGIASRVEDFLEHKAMRAEGQATLARDKFRAN